MDVCTGIVDDADGSRCSTAYLLIIGHESGAGESAGFSGEHLRRSGGVLGESRHVYARSRVSAGVFSCAVHGERFSYRKPRARVVVPLAARCTTRPPAFRVP